jgi:hypothetical protein
MPLYVEYSVNEHSLLQTEQTFSTDEAIEREAWAHTKKKLEEHILWLIPLSIIAGLRKVIIYKLSRKGRVGTRINNWFTPPMFREGNKRYIYIFIVAVILSPISVLIDEKNNEYFRIKAERNVPLSVSDRFQKLVDRISV